MQIQQTHEEFHQGKVYQIFGIEIFEFTYYIVADNVGIFLKSILYVDKHIKFSFDFFGAKINNPQNRPKMGNFRST